MMAVKDRLNELAALYADFVWREMSSRSRSNDFRDVLVYSPHLEFCHIEVITVDVHKMCSCSDSVFDQYSVKYVKNCAFWCSPG